MAIYECDYSRHRYPQVQQSIYWTNVVGAAAETYACRYCPKHFRDLRVELTTKFSRVDDDSTSSDTCEICNAPKAAVIYAKVFPAKEEMEYWVVDLCPACASKVGNDLRIFNGRPMGDRYRPLSSI